MDKTKLDKIKNHKLFKFKKVFNIFLILILITGIIATIYVATNERKNDTRTSANTEIDLENFTKKLTSGSENEITQVSLAQLRKPLIIEMAKNSPDIFLNYVISPEIREKLPDTVKTNIERKIEIEGSVLEIVNENETNTETSSTPSVIIQSLDADGFTLNSYRTYLREDLVAEVGSKVKATGYLIDNIFVPISIIELAPPTSYLNRISLANSRDVLGVNTLGNKKIAVISVTFPQDGYRNSNFTKEDLEKIYFSAPRSTANYLKIASFNKLNIRGDINDIYEVQIDPAFKRGEVCDIYETGRGKGFTKNLIQKAKYQAVSRGIDWATYDFIGFIFPYASGLCNGGPNGTEPEWGSAIARGVGAVDYNARPYHFLNGNYCMHSSNCPSLNGLNFYGSLMAHEVGHNMGLSHANGLNCGDKIIAGYSNCSSVTYADRFDVIGGGWTYNPSSMASNQNLVLNYIPDTNKTTITRDNIRADNTYTLYSSSKPRTNQLQFIRIPRISDNSAYYVEYRSSHNADSKLPDRIFKGALVRLSEVPSGKIRNETRRQQTYLLDMNNSPVKTSWVNFLNPAMNDGQSFTDTKNGIKITQLSHDLVEGSVKLKIDLLTTPCELANPGIFIEEPRKAGDSGQTVTYNITIINKNSLSCPDSTFNITLSSINNWKTNIPTTTTIVSGQRKTIKAQITSPTEASALNNPYKFQLMIKNNNNNDFLNSKYLLYDINSSSVNPNQISNIPTAKPTSTSTPTPKPTSTPTPSPSPIPTPIKVIKNLLIYPLSDSYVNINEPNANFGSAITLWADGNPNKKTYLKFDLGTMVGKNIEKIYLRLQVSSKKYANSDANVNLKPVSDNTWTEENLTWNTRSITDEPIIASVSNLTQGETVSFEITNYLKSKSGRITFQIGMTNDNGAGFFSKESSGFKPRLLIQYSE